MIYAYIWPRNVHVHRDTYTHKEGVLFPKGTEVWNVSFIDFSAEAYSIPICFYVWSSELISYPGGKNITLQ